MCNIRAQHIAYWQAIKIVFERTSMSDQSALCYETIVCIVDLAASSRNSAPCDVTHARYTRHAGVSGLIIKRVYLEHRCRSVNYENLFTTG